MCMLCCRNRGFAKSEVSRRTRAVTIFYFVLKLTFSLRIYRNVHSKFDADLINNLGHQRRLRLLRRHLGVTDVQTADSDSDDDFVICSMPAENTERE